MSKLNIIKLIQAGKRLLGVIRQFKGYGRQPTIRVVVRAAQRSEHGQVTFSGIIYTNVDPANLVFVVRKFRQEQVEFRSKMYLTRASRLKRIALLLAVPVAIVRAHKFRAFVDLPWSDLGATLYSVGADCGSLRAHIDAKSFRTVTLSIANGHAHAYMDPATNSLRIEFFPLSDLQIAELKSLARSRFTPSERVHCVIGEYTNSARDSGLALFRDLRENDRNITPYLVVERNNLDGFDVGRNGVVEYGSFEHMRACLRSNVVAFTHHRTYAYPHILSAIAPVRYSQARTVFLQHGVTAMKRSPVRHYRKGRVNYSAVIVCSQKERTIFNRHFGYSFTEVFAAGFPRHDNLFRLAQSNQAKDHLLVFPTWRAGIEKMSPHEASKTNYVKHWLAAIDVLRDITGLPVKFMMHPILQRHAELFVGRADEVLLPTSFQSELVKARLFVSDYSSTAFDALYIDCPVVLFQFDREEYDFRRDAFINIDTECPGVVALRLDELPQVVEQALGSPVRNAQLYFERRDNGNCERVATVIRAVAQTSPT